jgi:hypothetical protein
MSKIFALLGIALIVSGALVLGLPYLEETPSASRSLAPESAASSLIVRAREIAEIVQAPLSILFGLISLYWNRKNCM